MSESISACAENEFDIEDIKRRRFLTGLAAGVGGLGVGAAAVPFVLSMSPSERAKNAGAPTVADTSKLSPGMMMKVEWRGKPVVILKRTQEMMNGLKEITPELADPNSNYSIQPEYAKNQARADDVHSDTLIMLGVCTHLGCSPVEKLALGPDPQMGENSQGGFFCPCHGSKFDLSGRVYKNVPATTNMEVPPYQYEGAIVTIGTDDGRVV